MARAQGIPFEDARIIFRNFSGKEDKFNPKGKRSFNLILDAATADKMREDGFNVKTLKPRDEDDEPGYYVKVNVNMEGEYPPQVYMITGKNKTLLEGDAVNVLDHAEIATVDLVISPYHWETSMGSGTTAYLKTMYVTIVEDDFASKYRFEDEEEMPWN